MANIVAAAILAVAIIWTGGFGKSRSDVDEKELAELYARAVGDIRNDIVVNCGCCDEKGPRRADAGSF